MSGLNPEEGRQTFSEAAKCKYANYLTNSAIANPQIFFTSTNPKFANFYKILHNSVLKFNVLYKC
jgi:hypothetical protein